MKAADVAHLLQERIAFWSGMYHLVLKMISTVNQMCGETRLIMTFDWRVSMYLYYPGDRKLSDDLQALTTSNSKSYFYHRFIHLLYSFGKCEQPYPLSKH